MQHTNTYLLAEQPSELDRLQVQSRVWEPSGREFLAAVVQGAGLRALDVGCGVMGWLGVLSDWVGPGGTVVGSDIDATMLAHADTFAAGRNLRNITLVQDDVFSSRLERASFDLIHARFQIAPLGRPTEQLDCYRGLLKPGGYLILEEPEAGSWRVHPHAPNCARLIELIQQSFTNAGGNFSAGRELPSLLRRFDPEPRVSAHVLALPSHHPYLRLPLQFAASLRPRLEALLLAPDLELLLRQAEMELDDAQAWGTTFTLVQACARAR